MVVENLKCGFLSCYTGGVMEMLFISFLGARECACVHVPVKVCVGVCNALVCRLIFVYLLDNNEGFIFADKTLE